MKNITLDLSKPHDARKYINHFVATRMDSNPHDLYFDLSGGRRVWVKDMTDDDAVLIAHNLYDIEQATKNGGVQ
jgi:hypothetical protein